MGAAILKSSNSASLSAAVLITDTAHTFVRQPSMTCQFAQHMAAAEIIPTAAAWTDTTKTCK